jgi:hypothetical protein
MTNKTGGWIQTHNVRRVWPFDVDPGELDHHDMAHALARVCRFTGHTVEPYSVAQHCCLMARQAIRRGHGVEVALAALIHDASEAYLGDVSKYVKERLFVDTGPDPVNGGSVLERFVTVEDRLLAEIFRWAGIPGQFPLPEAVKSLDREALETEVRDCLAGRHTDWPQRAVPWPDRIVCWGHERAEAEWLLLWRTFRQWLSLGENPNATNDSKTFDSQAADRTGQDDLGGPLGAAVEQNGTGLAGG